MNPYVAGVCLGLVLLAAFVIMGRGLGASGAITSVVAVGVNAVSPSHAQGSAFYREYLPENKNPLKDWLVVEVAGLVIGGFISGLFSRRIKLTVDKGANASNRQRLLLAFFGGIIMGFGSKLARGCTSGQALTGGALLSVGSWVFMLAVFASAYAFAFFFRKEWN
ncbi:MAG: hypothetical protein EPO24_00320 [Bacteroidetes bacterium]|nr:MAG: hypothetical protein EPO24_00320 [Bacteroidota bacterium]